MMQITKSLKYKLLKRVIAFFLIFLFLDILYIYNKTKNDSIDELKSLNQNISQVLSKQILRDFVDYNYTEAKYIMDTYSNNMIKDIIVVSKDGYIFIQKSKDGLDLQKYPLFEQLRENSLKNSFIYLYPIKVIEKTLGYIIIKNDQQEFQKRVSKNLEEIVRVVFSMLIVFLLVLYFFNSIVIKPINKIVENIKDSSPDDLLKISYKKDDELGYLSRVIEEKHNRVTLLNDELKIEIDNVKSMNNTIKKQNEDIKKQEKLLIEQSKMVALGEMIGNIAHQWRQPLSVITTQVTGLLVQQNLGKLNEESVVNVCKGVNANAQYLSDTIEVFRNFIKGDTQSQNINLKTLFKEFNELIEGSLKSNSISLFIQSDENIVFNSYQNELTQCLMNLYYNSKDAFIQNSVEDRLLFIDAKKDKKSLVISFYDNAGGVSEDIVSKIFEPYFTTKHKSQGTGLGLYITYILISKQLDGTVEVSNKEYEFQDKMYKGASFKIVLPL